MKLAATLYYLLLTHFIIAQNINPAHIIKPQKVGIFSVNDNIDTIKKYSTSTNSNIRKIMLPGEEGSTYPAYIFTTTQGDKLIFTTTFDEATQSYTSLISDITVVSKNYATQQGIKVGSTITQFINTYKKYKLWYTYVGNQFVIETPLLAGIQFEINPHSFIAKKPLTQAESVILSLKDFSKNASIIKIRVL